MVSAAQLLAPAALVLPAVRRALARRLPAGTGPDAEVLLRGSFRSTLIGWADGEAGPLVGRVACDLDPGYGATARMLAAMGIGLATGAFAGSPVGVLTPAVAGGAAYFERLEAAGIRFELF